VAEAIVATEAAGVTTHGLAFLAYADTSIPGLIDPRARARVVSDRGATAVLDGGRCFAQTALRDAADLAVSKAAEYGIALVSVRDVGWLAALGVQLLPIAGAGMLAQLWAQTNTCKDCAPVGGIDARFSTNPVALVIPTDGEPIVADFSTAAISMGMTGRMAQEGRKAPEPIYMDRDGNYTDDPRAAKEGGTILFTGGVHHGHKGYGLSLWCEALTAAGGGEANNPESRTQQNFTLQVIDPGLLGGREVYTREMARFVRHVKSSRPRPGVPSVRLPGDRAQAALRIGRRDGVCVDETRLGQLEALARKTGIAGPG
jgi:L-lactate dehydrogenase